MDEERLLEGLRYVETTLIREASGDRFQESIDATAAVTAYLIRALVERRMAERYPPTATGRENRRDRG